MENSEGNRFKKQLDLLGVNQRKIATILNCNESFVSRMVKGKVNITYKTLHKIKKEIPDFDIEFVKPSETDKSILSKDDIIEELKTEKERLESELDRKNKMLDLILNNPLLTTEEKEKNEGIKQKAKGVQRL